MHVFTSVIFMIAWKSVYSLRLLSLPPMTGSQDANHEVKTGSGKCTINRVTHEKAFFSPLSER